MPDPAVDQREFDLNPHPRILPMLGEINLKQWQCISELVDNSIDGFLSTQREGPPIDRPEIHVSLASRVARDARITVLDNGPGMDPDRLENAVRAGWTGNDPVSNLGMFGMGFNIATARLGGLTRVWSTRAGAPAWYGLEIDFERLMRQRHFRTPMLSRPKADREVHGTEVSIERLKPEQGQWFASAANRAKIKAQLERVYSSMLRTPGTPLTIRIIINNNSLHGRQHCVWGGPGNPERIVNHARFGDISAYQVVDTELPPRPFCARCWQWLGPDEAACPSCEAADSVMVRQRRVRGWLGLQRYYDENEYGVDLLRHGRKIEIANKDLFLWDNGQWLEREYPIDDPRNRGRIVGEIHIDHCRVHYTKDQFDRNDPAWEEMRRIIRSEGPLRPDKAAERGYGANGSPLFRLFQAFRRNSPKPKQAGCYKNLLLVPDNDRAREMADRFHDGEAAFQTDAKWFELVEEADNALLVGEGAGGDGGVLGGPVGGGATGGGIEIGEQGEAPPQPPRAPIPSLTREYRDDTTEQRWEVRASSVQVADTDLGGPEVPWRLMRTTAGTYDFLVNVDHPVFGSATMTPLDALLAELAWSAMDFIRGQRPQVRFASVLAGLRERYAATMNLDPVVLSADAVATLRSLARSASENVEPGDAEALYQELSMSEKSAVLRRIHAVAGTQAARLLADGRFLEYAPKEAVLGFFERHPELFFDGRYWDTAYAALDLGDPALTEEARAEVLRRYYSLLVDAVWLADQDADDLASAGRTRLLRAALALELLSADQVRGES